MFFSVHLFIKIPGLNSFYIFCRSISFLCIVGALVQRRNWVVVPQHSKYRYHLRCGASSSSGMLYFTSGIRIPTIAKAFWVNLWCHILCRCMRMTLVCMRSGSLVRDWRQFSGKDLSCFNIEVGFSTHSKSDGSTQSKDIGISERNREQSSVSDAVWAMTQILDTCWFSISAFDLFLIKS